MAGNAREIRARIKSVRNTEKITRAMQMVAAAKVRRARERVEAAQPYADAMTEVFREVASQVPPSEYRSSFASETTSASCGSRGDHFGPWPVWRL
jgi:ATP synthase F1 gamma subunit